MKKKLSMKKYTILLLVFGLSFTACTDLDVKPKSTAVSDVVFTDPSSYRSFLAKMYAGLATTGQQGPAGDADIKGIDEGASDYIRGYWNLQELTTDEAVIGWNDGTIQTLHAHTWTSQSEFINGVFNRFYYQISLANQFLRETTDSKLASRGVTDDLKAQITLYRAEARLLRALSYWHALDLFGNIPFTTEKDEVGKAAPPQKSRAEVFAFVESELKDIENTLVEPKKNEYGRADRAVAWAILAHLYLNAEVYIGQKKYNESLTYADKIISSQAYSLVENYKNLFLADNNGNAESIFNVNYDGVHTQTYGGTNFLVHASIGGTMIAANYGAESGWGGLRTTKNHVNLYPDETGTTDKRAIFYRTGQSKEIPDKPNTGFTQGYAIPKWQNVTSEGITGSNPSFADTDFVLFRLADFYLVYAEAVLRGATNGSRATALNYINELRQRAYGNASGNIGDSDLTLDFIIDERGRELYWEAHRRTDLIRFGLFTDSPTDSPRALWPWKGDIAAGKETESFRDLFPLPSAQVIAYSGKLTQNTGY